jgi:hypothetical protein
MKILEIQGESYQNRFDNLRDKIYEKVDVTPQETILLTDFIQTQGIDEEVALSNITQRYVPIILLKLWKIDALQDVGLSIYDDVKVVTKVLAHPRLNTTNLQEIVDRANDDECDLHTACKHIEEELIDNLKTHLSYEPVYNMVDVEGVI